jgi:hypothetical protein
VTSRGEMAQIASWMAACRARDLRGGAKKVPNRAALLRICMAPASCPDGQPGFRRSPGDGPCRGHRDGGDVGGVETQAGVAVLLVLFCVAPCQCVRSAAAR